MRKYAHLPLANYHPFAINLYTSKILSFLSTLVHVKLFRILNESIVYTACTKEGNANGTRILTKLGVYVSR